MLDIRNALYGISFSTHYRQRGGTDDKRRKLSQYERILEVATSYCRRLESFALTIFSGKLPEESRIL